MSLTQFQPLRIVDVRRETDDAVSLAFEVPERLRESFAYVPGQYLTLRSTLNGEEVRRSYSICSGLDDAELRVAIKHVPDGLFSAHANTALRPGDTIEVMPPAGRFALRAGATGRVVLGLAAGSGITPVLSILKTVLAREPATRCILLYGSRNTASILFRGALEDLKDRFLGRLTVIHVLSREAQDVPVLNGRLDGAKLRALLPSLVRPAAIDQAFVCGPSGMIDDLTATLANLGVDSDRIRSERFSTAGEAVRTPRAIVAADRTATARAAIVFEGKTTEVPVADGETVLDAALRAGLDLPWSCRAGMCSTCRAHVRGGAVKMTQNFSLEPWETEAGYVLTCQAHPTTSMVTVDYDEV